MKEIMNRGYIRLWRKLNDWEWIGDPNVVIVFIHLLLDTNFKDKQWKGIDIPRGSILIGRQSFAKKTGLSERNVRTALIKLKSTNEVTIKTTNRYSLVSINNYNLYQPTDQPVANKRPATDQQLTTTNNVNNDNKSNTLVLETKVVPQKNTYIESLLNEFELLFGFPPTDKKPRFVAQAFRKNIEKFLKVFNPEITQDRFDRVVKEYFKWISNQDYAENIQKLEAIKLKFPVWSTPKVVSYQKGNHANNESKE